MALQRGLFRMKQQANPEGSWEPRRAGAGKADLRQTGRSPLILKVEYEVSVSMGDIALQAAPRRAYSVNVSSGGMCLLVTCPPVAQEVFRVHVPMAVPVAKTPTLAQVRWSRPLSFESTELYFVGVQFIL